MSEKPEEVNIKGHTYFEKGIELYYESGYETGITVKSDKATTQLICAQAGKITINNPVPPKGKPANPGWDSVVIPEGNVGIGTESPSAKLHVSGDVKFERKLHVTDDVKVDGKFVVNGKADISGKLNIPSAELGKGISNVGNGDYENRCITMYYGDDNNRRAGINIKGQGSNLTHLIYAQPGKVVINKGVQGSGWDNVVVPDGNVGIGTESPDKKLHVNGDVMITGSLQVGGWEIKNEGRYLKFNKGNKTYVLFDTSGDYYIGHSSEKRNPRSTRWSGYNWLSDRRFKEGINSVERILDKIGKIKLYSYDWNDHEKVANLTKTPQIGLMADELNEVFPEFVGEDDDGFKRVDYGQLSSVLFQGVNELSEKISQQQAFIQSEKNSRVQLQSRLTSLEEKNAKLAQDLAFLKSQFLNRENET